MYQAHFGLKTGIFAIGIAHEEAVFIGPFQQTVVGNFKVALTTADAAVVLTGPAGVGKTTLAAEALRGMSPRLALGWLNHPPANGPEVVELLLAEFGLTRHRMGRVESLRVWRQFLNEMNATDSRVIVVVERADELTTEVLRTLEAMTAAEPNRGPGVNIVLIGTAALNDRLRTPALASLNQRVRLRRVLDSLTLEELDAYLRHRVARAGGSFDQVFSQTAVDALHRYSEGLPRVVNNLCETALALAAAGEEPRLTKQLIVRAAVGFYGMEPIAIPPDAVALAASLEIANGDSLEAGAAEVAMIEVSLGAGNVGDACVGHAPAVGGEADDEPIDVEGMEDASAAIALALAALVDADANADAEIAAEVQEIVAITATPRVATRRGNVSELAHPVTALPAAQTPHGAHELPVLTDAVDEHSQTLPSAVAAPVTYRPIQPLEPAVISPAQVDDLLTQSHCVTPASGDLHEASVDGLFDDTDLNMLSAALASAGWADFDDELEHATSSAATDDSATLESPRGMFSCVRQPLRPATRAAR